MKKMFFTLCLMLIASCSYVQNRSEGAHYNVYAFISLFDKARAAQNTEVARVNDVNDFILNCCKDPSISTQLLKDASFDVRQISKKENPSFFERYKNQVALEKEDDVYIYGSKLVRSLGFRARKYEIRLYIRNGKVDRASGVVRHAYAPL